MKIDANMWAAIGACATAVFTFLALCIQRKSLSLQQHSLAIQETRYKGKVLFSLERNGKYIAAVLQNTGEEEVSDIRIHTVPVLEVPELSNKVFPGVSRTWVIPNTTIERLLPHQVMRDDEAFLATEFDVHFRRDFSITATINYIQNGKNITSTQIIDSTTLSRIEHEITMRQHRNESEDARKR